MFIDIPVGHKYYNAIEYVNRLNIMSSMGGGTFQADSGITIEQMCKIVVCLLLGDVPLDANIPDCSWSNRWSAPYVEYCRVSGYFNCDKECSAENFIRPVSKHDLHMLLHNISKEYEYFVVPSLVRDSSEDASRGYVANCLYHAAKETGENLKKKLNFKCLEDCKTNWKLLEEYHFCSDFLEPDIGLAYRLIKGKKKKEKTTLQDYELLWFMVRISNEKRDHFQRTNENVFHYTSIFALEKLTQKNAKFRLSNVAYLNDPEEGKILISLARDALSKHFAGWDFLNQEMAEIAPRESFVGSFTICPSHDESLPMWFQYGDAGKGCRIEFDTSKFDGGVYQVEYQTENMENYIKQLKLILIEFTNEYGINDYNDNPVFLFAEAMLQQASYLCKDEHYKHENEARIVIFLPLTKALEEEFIRPGESFPRLFTDIDLSDTLKIKGITFGPKTSNIEKIVGPLVKRGICPDCIKKSKVHYR